MSNRKRRASGASPQTSILTYPPDADLPAETFTDWNDSSLGAHLSAFNNSSLFDGFGEGMEVDGQDRVAALEQGDGSATNMGQLVRRNPNQQLAPAPRRHQWDGYPKDLAQPWEAMDDEQELEQKAAVAKKDAQAKRKQIPPFVQKLSSFLEDNRNSELIRWSADGSSFIVLDEDKFAHSLIPELFKHKNYASFVRQLNMYGFHKKVGLSDNSMKASETKAKAPSEYYNKYFKRGRPEWLWLIQKPKNPPTTPKRKRDDDGSGGGGSGSGGGGSGGGGGGKDDSDEDRRYAQDVGSGGYVEELAVRNSEQMAMIPRSEYNSLRVEVRELQQQQKLISNVLSQIKRQNEELYSRATSFQALHDRHENSINAILTFLATFYNRSLEGNTNGMNLADMFPAARQQPRGNVVDVEEFPSQELSKSTMIQRNKKPLAILPAPPATQPDVLSPVATGHATTLSPAQRPTASPASPAARPDGKQTLRRPPSPSLRQSGPQRRDGPILASSQLHRRPDPSPLAENDEIMSAIQSANHANADQPSRQAPQFDFPAALSKYETQDGQVPLTRQQRNDALSRIANNVAAQDTNNALTNPEPPDMSSFIHDLYQYQATQQQLELLQKMSEEQNSRVQSIQERLLPHSPTGQIPGLTDDSYFGNQDLGDPGQYDLDLDSFVQDQDFFGHRAGDDGAQQANGGPTNDAQPLPDFAFDTPIFEKNVAQVFDFNTGDDGSGGAQEHLLRADKHGGKKTESLTSSGTPSPTTPTVEEIEDEDSIRRSPKRRRR